MQYNNWLIIFKHPKMDKCQMDPAEALEKAKKFYLLLLMLETHFMFIRLLDKKDIKSVNLALLRLITIPAEKHLMYFIAIIILYII